MYPSQGPEGVRRVGVATVFGDGPLKYDARFKDMSPRFVSLLKELGVMRVLCGITPGFGGHSFEMAVVMSALGVGGTFSGIVDRWDADHIYFQPANGVQVKKSAYRDMLTPREIPSIRRRPTDA